MKTRILLCGIGIAAALYACTPEESMTITDTSAGQYPMTFAASAENWDTTESGSVWNGGESVIVRLDGTTKEYVLTDAEKGLLSAGDEAFRWEDNKDVTIDAWYPASENGNGEMPPVIVKADQSALEAYHASDFLIAEQETVSMSPGASPLSLTHRTANILVRLQVEADLGLSDVGIRLLNLKDVEGGNPEIIPLEEENTYKAMVSPQDMQGVEFISVLAGPKYSTVYTPGSFRDGYLRAGHRYTWDIVIEKEGVKVIRHTDEGDGMKWIYEDETVIEAQPKG